MSHTITIKRTGHPDFELSVDSEQKEKIYDISGCSNSYYGGIISKDPNYIIEFIYSRNYVDDAKKLLKTANLLYGSRKNMLELSILKKDKEMFDKIIQSFWPDELEKMRFGYENIIEYFTSISQNDITLWMIEAVAKMAPSLITDKAFSYARKHSNDTTRTILRKYFSPYEHLFPSIPAVQPSHQY